MRYRLFLFLLPGIMSGLLSCSVHKPVASSYSSLKSAEDYINTYKYLAVSEMKRTGIPASITLAQGMIESDYGRSLLAREANNHFGIKCHDDWTGPTLRKNDDRRNECFRRYKRPEDSFYDHSDFLKNGSRYTQLFNIDPVDYKSWARGLKRAGYATNPDYAELLIRNIELNNLWYFDRGFNSNGGPIPTDPTTIATTKPMTTPTTTLTTTPSASTSTLTLTSAPASTSTSTSVVFARTPRVMENNRIQYIIVKDGDTRDKIENEFQLLRWELSRYNELDDNFTLYPGQILYLQPKRKKADAGKEFYKTAEGDTMYLISQRYGIQLNSLIEMNRTTKGTEPEAGTKIWLRSIKPVN